MVKEFRALSRAEAVEAMYQDMAARHRARFRNVQILRVAEIEKKEDVRRPYIKQLLEPGLKFPLPHRRTKSKAWYAANRPVSCLSLESPSCADDSLPGLKLDHSYRFRMYWRVRRQMHLFYDHDIGKVGDDTDEVARMSARIRSPWSLPRVWTGSLQLDPTDRIWKDGTTGRQLSILRSVKWEVSVIRRIDSGSGPVRTVLSAGEMADGCLDC